MGPFLVDFNTNSLRVYGIASLYHADHRVGALLEQLPKRQRGQLHDHRVGDGAAAHSPVDIGVTGGDVHEAQKRGHVLAGPDVLYGRAPVLRVDDVHVDLNREIVE